MYSAVLWVLLFGMLPVPAVPSASQVPIIDIPVASPSPLKGFKPSTPFEVGRLSASGVLISDLESGQVIYASGENIARPMASLTKLMTAIIIAENEDLNEWVTVPDDVSAVDGAVERLPKGKQFTVGDLLSALLISSANDAAETLARHHAGSVTEFVSLMNARAEMLGLQGTHFSNPAGLDALDQRSTAADVAWLASFAFRHQEIRDRLSMRGTKIQSRDGTVIALTHTHALLHTDSPVFAGKTGTTNGARQCLLSFATIKGRTYVVVLLNSLQRYKDMQKVLKILQEPFA
jgi:D-alanyl-D-alanine carboxypeptidase